MKLIPILALAAFAGAAVGCSSRDTGGEGVPARGGTTGGPSATVVPHEARTDTAADDALPRRTDIPAATGARHVGPPPLNERKPMPNDGERANQPGSLPLPLP